MKIAVVGTVAVFSAGSSNVGIQLNTGSSGGVFLSNNGGAGARFYNYTGAIGSESYTEVARIDSSGNLLVGTTSVLSTGKTNIQFDGNTQNAIVAKTTYASATGSNFYVFLNSAGNVAGYIQQSGTTTVSYTTSSDYRLKENVVPMTGALATVAQLKPVKYKWKSDGSDGQGFIAHELQAVVSDCVTGTKDELDAEGNPKYQGIDTSFLVATLTAAIKELKAINDTQDETINALTARIVALEAK